MIASITGTVSHHHDQWIILETVSGIGYKIYTSSGLLAENSTVRLWTYQHIREDINDLYGFSDLNDLATFELLLTVSGVGPKMALTIVSTLGRQTISDAVLNNQPAILRSVSGVGQKVAEKIILELKNKVSGLAATGLIGSESNDLFEALLNLGYHQKEVAETLKKVDSQLPTGERLKMALRLLGQ